MAVTAAPRSIGVPAYGDTARARTIRSILKYVLLILVGIVALIPFILAFLGTFKTDAEIIAYPPTFLPKAWLVRNWALTWNTDFGQGATFPRWLLNTAVLAVGSAALQLVFCSM